MQEVNVEVGERITKGQVLAVLDDSNFKLNVEAAQAAVRGAEAGLREARQDYERTRRMAAEDIGAVSQRALDQAKAAYDAARETLSYNTSRLNLARRDVDRTATRRKRLAHHRRGSRESRAMTSDREFRIDERIEAAVRGRMTCEEP